MFITRHQTAVDCDLFGKVNLCFIASGPTDNPDFRVTDAWVDVTEDGTVTQLNAGLTRTRYSRVLVTDLPPPLFAKIRLSAWDVMLDQMQRDRDPSMNADRMVAAE